MKWISNQPIFSTMQPRIDVNDYKKDYKFDYIKGDIVLNEYVEGIDRFIQLFKSLILSNVTITTPTGLLELIPKSKDQLEFNSQCEKLSDAIITHKFSDSTLNSPHGLGYTAEYIYSIEKAILDDIDYLIIETKVTGISDKLTIKVPLILIEKHL